MSAVYMYKKEKGEKNMIQKDSGILMFIAALFAIAKTWKKPKCSQMQEWIKKMWHIYTREYYSTIKNGIMPFAATWMDHAVMVHRDCHIK